MYVPATVTELVMPHSVMVHTAPRMVGLLATYITAGYPVAADVKIVIVAPLNRNVDKSDDAVPWCSERMT